MLLLINFENVMQRAVSMIYKEIIEDTCIIHTADSQIPN